MYKLKLCCKQNNYKNYYLAVNTNIKLGIQIYKHKSNSKVSEITNIKSKKKKNPYVATHFLKQLLKFRAGNIHYETTELD